MFASSGLSLLFVCPYHMEFYRCVNKRDREGSTELWAHLEGAAPPLSGDKLGSLMRFRKEVK